MTETICEFSRLDQEQGHYNCNKLVETTVYRKDGEKKVCAEHAKELAEGEHVFTWRLEE